MSQTKNLKERSPKHTVQSFGLNPSILTIFGDSFLIQPSPPHNHHSPPYHLGHHYYRCVCRTEVIFFILFLIILKIAFHILKEAKRSNVKGYNDFLIHQVRGTVLRVSSTKAKSDLN
jgi:hypothetical protein